MPSKKRRVSQQCKEPERLEHSDPKSQQESVSEPEYSSDDPDKPFEVEAILDHWPNYMGTKGNLRYLIAWKGYDCSYNTWEPVECLEGCSEMRERYDDRVKKESEQHVHFLQNGSEKRKRACQQVDPAYIYNGFDIRKVKASEIPEEEGNSVATEVAFRHYGMMRSWESVVQKVVGVRRMDDDCLAFDLDFERDFQFSFKYDVVKRRCPQKLIDYLMERNGLQQSQLNAQITFTQNTINPQPEQTPAQNPQQNQAYNTGNTPGSANEVEELIEHIQAPWVHIQTK